MYFEYRLLKIKFTHSNKCSVDSEAVKFVVAEYCSMKMPVNLLNRWLFGNRHTYERKCFWKDSFPLERKVIKPKEQQIDRNQIKIRNERHNTEDRSAVIKSIERLHYIHS